MNKQRKQDAVVEEEQPIVATGNMIYWSTAYKGYLRKFILDNPQIKRIAVIGFGDGMLQYQFHFE